MYQHYVKRLLDFVFSLILLLLLWPVILIIWILVRVKLGSPAFFKQERPGKDEKIFTLYKFRSMTDSKDEKGNLLPDDERLTKFGKLLRKTSLDELPELWNILKGDMSFVGPRPLLKEYLPYYSETEKQRHIVRPGLTGLAQVNGRNIASWDERLQNDILYVNHISFLEDLKIFLKTIAVVFRKEGINDSNNRIKMSLIEYKNNQKKR